MGYFDWYKDVKPLRRKLFFMDFDVVGLDEDKAGATRMFDKCCQANGMLHFSSITRHYMLTRKQ